MVAFTTLGDYLIERLGQHVADPAASARLAHPPAITPVPGERDAIALALHRIRQSIRGELCFRSMKLFHGFARSFRGLPNRL